MRKNKFYSYEAEEQPKQPLGQRLGISGWDVAKLAVGLTASGCATVVANRYLSSILPESRNLAEKIVTSVGVYFVTGMVGHKVENYVGEELEQLKNVLDSVNRTAEQIKEAANGDRSE